MQWKNIREHYGLQVIQTNRLQARNINTKHELVEYTRLIRNRDIDRNAKIRMIKTKNNADIREEQIRENTIFKWKNTYEQITKYNLKESQKE